MNYIDRRNYIDLIKQWQDCQKCCLCQKRYKVVMVRGTVPCDILFIGEAPGESEDITGQPFIGPAGKLLDSIIDQSNLKFRIAICNLVGCIPKYAGYSKSGEPNEQEILACLPRLRDIIRVCLAKKIVTIGLLAKKWVEKKKDMLGLKDISISHITHPAAILRYDGYKADLAIKECVATLKQQFQSSEREREKVVC